MPPKTQDSIGWSDDLIREAEGTLWPAATLRQPRPFQIEVAIQSARAQRRVTGQRPWRAIAPPYGVLVQHHANLGARAGHAVAQAEAGEPAAADEQPSGRS